MEAFRISEITPDFISIVPEKPIRVIYSKSGKEVKLGNELTPTDVIESPEVRYDADASSFYTLIFTDPDATREWPHWVVVNIPGSQVSKGEVINEYVGSAPPKGAKLHRYVFLLYRQPKKLTFDEPYHSDTDPRRVFSTKEFTEKYNLGNPVAGNFYLAQYDDSVPATYKKLGFSA